MPEAAIHEHRDLLAPKKEIWTSGYGLGPYFPSLESALHQIRPKAPLRADIRF